MTKRKTGRNTLCPCGSGKKFNECCMNSFSEHASAGEVNDTGELRSAPVRFVVYAERGQGKTRPLRRITNGGPRK
jgi:uncharacterized protein YchJ